MSSEVIRAFFRVAIFLVLVSGALVLATQSNVNQRAEFVASVCSLGVGLTLLALVLIVERMGRR
jgi:hypothetical protein